MTNPIKNDSKLRGTIYFLAAVLAGLGAAFTEWGHTPPANWYVVAAQVVSSLSAGVIALRAFIDQHISNNPLPEDMNKPVTKQVTTQIEPEQVVVEKTIAPEVKAEEVKVIPTKPGEVVYTDAKK